MIKIGVSPINWTNDGDRELGDNISLEQCLSEANSIGYKGIELGRKFPLNKEKLSEILKKYDLELVSSWHSGFLSENSLDTEINNAESKIKLLKDMNCKFINYGEIGCQPTRPFGINNRTKLIEINWKEYINKLNTLSEYFDSNSISLAFHPHMCTLIENEDEIDMLIQHSNEKLKICFDTGHLFYSGCDPLKIFNKYYSKIIHIHLKDIRLINMI